MCLNRGVRITNIFHLFSLSYKINPTKSIQKRLYTKVVEMEMANPNIQPGLTPYRAHAHERY